jgi:hypothetical protein
MTTYFACGQARAPALSGQIFSSDDSRPDLLGAQYAQDRKKVMTKEKEVQIETQYKTWCDLLFSGYNVVVTGPNSKFGLLETFKKRFLDSEKLLDLATGAPLNILTVRLHGLDPIKAESFNHVIFGIKETRRVKDSDYQSFSQMIREEKLHYVFLIHSIEYFLDACEEVCDTIFKIHSMNPEYVHIVASSDHWNASLRLRNLQHSLQLIYMQSSLPGIDSALWEKTQLIGSFDFAENRATDTAMHRLFADKTDLQSLKDIYQALDSATQKILAYIIKDLIDKSESIANDAASSKKRFQAYDAEDDEEGELNDEEKADDVVPMRTRSANSNSNNKERTRSNNNNDNKRTRSSVAQKSISTYLDFQHLLKYCESNFIVRRGAALRDHLGELKDHKLVASEDAGNKIQCLVDTEIGKKFLAWINEPPN